jgi:Na+-transporting NADH:ubiquinone oxidoreductase subunit NqrF
MSILFIDEKTQNISKVDCYRELNLLAHAQIEEIEIGSRCGGHGICGGDKIKIITHTSKLSSITELEQKHLSPNELKQGWRLACQSWPDSDQCDIKVQINQHE